MNPYIITAAIWALTSTSAMATEPDSGIFEGRIGSLLHPITMENVKSAVCWYYTNWLKWHPNNYEPSPKVHLIFSHVAPAMKEHGMLGRLSEEGFESMHPELNSQKTMITVPKATTS
jgi:hypothetical protein